MDAPNITAELLDYLNLLVADPGDSMTPSELGKVKSVEAFHMILWHMSGKKALVRQLEAIYKSQKEHPYVRGSSRPASGLSSHN